MKLKDTPIAGKLPKAEPVDNVIDYQHGIYVGKNLRLYTILNTELPDANECVEVDVEKVYQAMIKGCPNCGGQGWVEGTETVRGDDGLPEPAQCQIQCDCNAVMTDYLAKAGILKWRKL